MAVHKSLLLTVFNLMIESDGWMDGWMDGGEKD